MPVFPAPLPRRARAWRPPPADATFIVSFPISLLRPLYRIADECGHDPAVLMAEALRDWLDRQPESPDPTA